VSLDDWLSFGWLQEHPPSQQEIADLFAIADRDLEACATPNLIADWRFNIACNAASQLATAALAAAGFRAERSNHHFRIIQSLEFTVGLAPSTIQKSEIFRKKRNMADYERVEAVSDLEVDQMRQLAANLRTQVKRWIRQHHPSVSPEY